MDAPPEIEALHAAYVAESGLPVSLSEMRKWALAALHLRGFTPDDVRAVLRAIRKKIARGDPGYSEMSMNFKNAIGDPDTFEERALLLRQQAARRTKPRPQVARTDAAGVTRLDEAPAAEAKRADVAKALHGLAKEISGKGPTP